MFTSTNSFNELNLSQQPFNTSPLPTRSRSRSAPQFIPPQADAAAHQVPALAQGPGREFKRRLRES